MRNSKNIAKKIFAILSADLTKARPDIAGEIACPLCLLGFRIEAIDDGRLSLEHIIPSALGGTLATLTCTRCNNSHGARLDRNFVSALKAIDGLEGCGLIPAVIHNENGHVEANIHWRAGAGETTEIAIVGPASHPAGVKDICDNLHDGAELNVTLKLNFIPERYWMAVFRAAYLATFEQLGYVYVLSDGGEQVRRILNGTEPVPPVILRAHPTPEPRTKTWVIPILGDNSFVATILRPRTASTCHLAVLLPLKARWEALIELATQHKGLRVRGAHEENQITVRFGADPVKAMLEMLFSPGISEPQ